jgi:hypothetical protein
MRLVQVALAVVGVVAAGCAHDSEGHVVRSGKARFDAQTLTSPTVSITINADGTWGECRIQRVGDQLRGTCPGTFDRFGGYIGDHHGGYIQIEDLPDGVRYTPSFTSAPIWTFVTEDGRPIPADLEIPLYLAAGIGLGGHWVELWTPAQDDRGPQLLIGCGQVLFEIRGRQVAGWRATQGASCPAPVYPGRETLARLIDDRNEVWLSPVRPLP